MSSVPYRGGTGPVDSVYIIRLRYKGFTVRRRITSATAIGFLQQMEKEQGERYDILLIVLNNRDQRTTVACLQVGFIEFRYHLTGNILITADAKDCLFKRSKAEGGEMVLPSPPAEMKDIEMRYSCQRPHTIVGKTV
jgi:hypothetical protein